MKIEWRNIKDFPGYRVSSTGKVKGVKFIKPMALSPDWRGYLTVGLSRDKKRYTFNVHRLVLEAFSQQSGETVNHKNGVKTDNRIENLEWMTAKENCQHGWATGLYNRRRKIPEEKKDEIVRRYRAGDTQVALAKEFSVLQSAISHMITTRTLCG